MSSRGRRGRRGNQNRQRAVRQIANKIHSMHLNSAPTWYRIASRVDDPPPYVTDVIYSRKVRVTSIVSTFSVTYQDIRDAIGLTQANFFTRMFVRRIDAYGDTTNSISLTPHLADTPVLTRPDRAFTDIGVPGSRRPHISVNVSPKDSSYVTLFSQIVCTGGSVTFNTFVPPIIIDFFVEFFDSAVTNVVNLPASNAGHISSIVSDVIDSALNVE